MIGWVLHAHDMRWAIENGLKTYDFCHGNEPYKYSYGAEDRLVRHVVVSHRSGANLNDALDSASVEDVMEAVVAFIDAGRLEEAKIGCRQILAVNRSQTQRSPSAA